MKKSKITTLIIMFIFGVTVFSSCKRSNNNKTPTQFSQTKILHNATVNGINLPDGTKAIRINKSKVKFIFPKGFQLWYLDNNHHIQKMAESGYTCSCSSSGGCNVVYVKEQYGCMQGGCTGSCTGTPGKGLANRDNIAFVNLNQKISPVQSQKEFDSLSYIPKFLLYDPQIAQMLKTYARSIYKKDVDINSVLKKIDTHKGFNSDINNIVYVQMKMLGYKFIYGILVNDLTKAKSTNNMWNIAPSKAKCECKSGTSGCTSGSIWGVKYCKGGSCTKCKMN